MLLQRGRNGAAPSHDHGKVAAHAAAGFGAKWLRTQPPALAQSGCARRHRLWRKVAAHAATGFGGSAGFTQEIPVGTDELRLRRDELQLAAARGHGVAQQTVNCAGGGFGRAGGGAGAQHVKQAVTAALTASARTPMGPR